MQTCSHRLSLKASRRDRQKAQNSGQPQYQQETRRQQLQNIQRSAHRNLRPRSGWTDVFNVRLSSQQQKSALSTCPAPLRVLTPFADTIEADIEPPSFRKAAFAQQFLSGHALRISMRISHTKPIHQCRFGISVPQLDTSRKSSKGFAQSLSTALESSKMNAQDE